MYKVDLYIERRQRRDLFASKEAAVVGRTQKRLNLLSKRKCCSASTVPADILLSFYTTLLWSCIVSLSPAAKGQLLSCKCYPSRHNAVPFPKSSKPNILCSDKKTIDFIICNTPDTLVQLQREIPIRLLALLPISDATSLFLLLYNCI